MSPVSYPAGHDLYPSRLIRKPIVTSDGDDPASPPRSGGRGGVRKYTAGAGRQGGRHGAHAVARAGTAVRHSARPPAGDAGRGAPRARLAQLPYWLLVCGTGLGLLWMVVGGERDVRGGTLVIAG